MLNGQLNDFGAETHLTQVASYFDIVDNAVKTGDTNKRYSISTNVSTAPSPPIAEGSWTSIHISPTADNMCDLTNSYIVVTMEVLPTINSISGEAKTKVVVGGRNPAVWIGFKDALDAIEQYQIVANGQAIYTQPHAIEESYITNLATPDTVRNRDVFQKATVEQIYNRSDCVMTGGVIDIVNTEATTAEQKTINFPFTPAKPIQIKLKIDIRRILPLAAIKYLPAFVGNLELKVKFSTAGMVVLPMPLEDYAKDPYLYHMAKQGTEDITTCFLPVTEEFNAYTTQEFDKVLVNTINMPVVKYTISTLKISLGRMSVTECKSCLCCFGIDDGIYQSLVQRYTGQSLSFPTQTLTFQAMNGIMGGKGQTKVDLALTSTPRFVDTILLLFPYNSKYRTVYVNPLFDSFRLTMGGYGSCPDMPISSYGPYFYEMLQNAFNMNSDLMGLNEDVMRSAILNPELNNWPEQTQGRKANDISNFVIAIPTSTDSTFQQGQTSAAPITYEFKGTLNTNSMFANEGVNCTPLMGFLKDSIIAIQLRPNGPPIVAIDEYDITSPAGQ